MKIHFNCFLFFLMLLPFFFLTTPIAAQDYNREVGVRFSSLTSFGMIYKKKKSEDKYRRWRLGVAGAGFTSNEATQAFTLQGNLAVGIEKRKAINDKFNFVHGFEFLGSLGANASEGRGSLTVSPGVGFVLGFQYALADAFFISLETIPSVRANFSFDENGFRDSFGINAGFSSQAAALSLVYRFNSKKGMKGKI